MAKPAGGGTGGGEGGDEEDPLENDGEGLSMNEISQFLQDLERLNEAKEQAGGGRFGPSGKLKRSYRSRMQRDAGSTADEAVPMDSLEHEIMRIFGDDDSSAEGHEAASGDDEEELGRANPESPGSRKTRRRSRGANALARASLLEDAMGRQPPRRSGSLADLSDDAEGGSAGRWEPSLEPKELSTPEQDRENWLQRDAGGGGGGGGGGEENATEEDKGEREDDHFPPRSTRELFEEAMETLTPELRNMWMELSKLAGNSKAVALLQDIVRTTPDGMVQPELFQALFPFELDQFQTQALRGLSRRKNVIVSAPTGSGKTVVGELAVYYALALNLRVFYTTPLKALSNQKFADFRRQFGRDKVGLLTGDNNYNRDAQVAVMTTEVFRNMLYDTEEAENGLSDVFAVVFDEFHYMNDRDRGTVWEESVINCPKEMLLVALSATMSNVGEIKDWIQHTHGPSSLVVSDFRPVPLTYWFATSDGLFHLFQDPNSGPGARNGGHKAGDPVQEEQVNIGSGGGFAKPLTRRERRRRNQPPVRLRINPELLHSHEEEMSSVRRYLEDEGTRYGGGDRSRGRGSRRGSRYTMDRDRSRGGRDRGSRGPEGGNRRDRRRNEQSAMYRTVPSYPFTIRCLARKDLLPAIVFIFSRVGCDQAAKEVGDEELGLLSRSEKLAVRERLQAFREANPKVLVPDAWRALLLKGISTHHAGLLPLFKSFVEELFADALVKVVFATETLAAGVNMPARATVITTLSKRIDTGIVKLNPSQLLQMGGRAGRRGKDVEGSVVLMRSRFEDCVEAHRLLMSPMDGIESQFKSSYGMAVGILRSRDMSSAKTFVEKSFGNFLRRKQMMPAQVEARKAEERLEELRGQLGGIDITEAKAYRKLRERKKSEEGILSFLEDQDREAEQEVVETILPFARLGAGITLRDGRTTALVGEYPFAPDGDAEESGSGFSSPSGASDPWPMKSIFHAVDGDSDESSTLGGEPAETRRYLVLDGEGEMEAVPASQMRFIDCAQEAGLDPDVAAAISAMVKPTMPWVSQSPGGLVDVRAGRGDGGEASPERRTLPSVSRRNAHKQDPWADLLGLGGYAAADEDEALRLRRGDAVPNLRPPPDESGAWESRCLVEAGASMILAELPATPGHIIRQMAVVDRVKDQLESHPIHRSRDPESVASIISEIAPLEEKVRQGWKTQQKLKQPAWAEFLAVCRVLMRYGALEVKGEGEDPKPTAFGRMLGAINADNELWIGLVLTRPTIQTLTYTELASLMPAISNEYLRSDVRTLYGASEAVEAFLEELEPVASELSEIQFLEQAEVPVRLDGLLCGLVEGWASGCDWSELVASTSLDQGDLCRILRRSMEMLRQIPGLPLIPAVLKDRARLAAESLDRFPVSDEASALVRDAPAEEGGPEQGEEEHGGEDGAGSRAEGDGEDPGGVPVGDSDTGTFSLADKFRDRVVRRGYGWSPSGSSRDGDDQLGDEELDGDWKLGKDGFAELVTRRGRSQSALRTEDGGKQVPVPVPVQQGRGQGQQQSGERFGEEDRERPYGDFLSRSGASEDSLSLGGVRGAKDGARSVEENDPAFSTAEDSGRASVSDGQDRIRTGVEGVEIEGEQEGQGQGSMTGDGPEHRPGSSTEASCSRTSAGAGLFSLWSGPGFGLGPARRNCGGRICRLG